MADACHQGYSAANLDCGACKSNQTNSDFSAKWIDKTKTLSLNVAYRFAYTTKIDAIAIILGSDRFIGAAIYSIHCCPVTQAKQLALSCQK